MRPLLPPWLLIRSQRSLSSSSSSSSSFQILSQAINASPDDLTVSGNNLGDDKNGDLSTAHVVESLLSHRNDPDRAFDYFKTQRGFVRGISEPYCVLLHILVSDPTHSTEVKKLINEYVSSDTSPSGILLFDHMVNCSERFDFELNSVVFDYLLNSYVRAGRCREAIDCLNAMILKGIMPSVRILNYTLSTLVRKNMISEAQSRKMFDEIVSTGVGNGYDCATVDIIMRGCLKEGRVEEARGFFARAKASGLVLDDVVYTTAIEGFCSVLDVGSACELLCEMKQMGWVPSEVTFTKVVRACVERRNMVEALRVKDEMMKCGCSMNLEVATSLMKGYCRLQGDVNAALALFSKLVEDGICPNKDTYAVLIIGCCKNGNMEKASELYGEMKLADIQPKRYVVHSLINGFLTAGMLDEATKHFNDAVDADIANVGTYNMLLHWFAVRGKVSEARAIWEKMEKSRFELSVVSYNDMILGNCRVGDMNAALSLLSGMVEKKFKGNAHTYCNLIDGYFKKGEKELALEMFDKMVNSGVAPAEVAYNIVINGLCKSGCSNEAKSWLDKLVGMEFQPLHQAYNSVIHGFVKENAINSALSVYSEMSQNGISPNVVTYTSLINGFCKANYMDHALKLYCEMKRKGIKRDLTVYSALIDGFCKKGDLESAGKLFDEIFEDGLSANIVVYNSMISGYRDIQNMGAALSLHKRMINEGISCDLATYTTVIDVLFRDGKLLNATNMYVEVRAKGIVPDSVLYNVMERGLCNKEQLDNARKVYDDLRAKNMTPNVVIYHTVIAGNFKENNLQEALRMNDEMHDRGLTPDEKLYDILVAGKFR